MHIGFSLKFSDKNRFLDRKVLDDVISNAERKFLMDSGAWVRKVARNSIRKVGKKGKPSEAGTPPKWRVGKDDGLRRIWFVLASDNKSVDIGPVKYNGQMYGSMTVPQLHEFGGRVQGVQYEIFGKITNYYPSGWLRVNPKLASKINRLPRMVVYPPRPYMRPALHNSQKKITEIMVRSIRQSIAKGVRAAKR